MEVIEKVMDFAREAGYGLLHLEYSPIKGPEGNIEYLLHLKKSAPGLLESPQAVARQIVEQAHQELDR